MELIHIRSKRQLETEKKLPRSKGGSETERFTLSGVTIKSALEPRRSGLIIRRVQIRPDNFSHRRIVRAIEKIRPVGAELQTHRAIILEAERFAHSHIHASIVRPYPCVATDFEEPVVKGARVAIRIGPCQQRKRYAAANKNRGAQADVGQYARAY